ncbi:unnamed protein product [Eruca vesicaria subsp. sativa]|uniref:Uncharacterized protein n=1 Tax=Eruca vesicaria subsp. sativa TaxID=29727 RepID=A0ABC8JUR0_ERUVS|nr:unnamed protein product [Eruca vesicaria subsp. sativa]
MFSDPVEKFKEFSFRFLFEQTVKCKVLMPHFRRIAMQVAYYKVRCSLRFHRGSMAAHARCRVMVGSLRGCSPGSVSVGPCFRLLRKEDGGGYNITAQTELLGFYRGCRLAGKGRRVNRWQITAMITCSTMEMRHRNIGPYCVVAKYMVLNACGVHVCGAG